MTVFVLVRKESYYDSVLLMRISQTLRALPGAADAVAVMGTPQNRVLLVQQGFGGAALDGAGPNDLVLAVRGAGVTPEEVNAAFEKLLASERSATAVEEARPSSLGAALAAHPDANVVLVSVPGEYAAREARRALRAGRHVMLFSDNVAFEDEVALKREAVGRGLLMMGPDCGTAILNGLPLGFANAVRRGPIGIVGAAGTGIQEVSSLIHRMGGGISQAIGTGGRDLTDEVGGLMMLFGLAALAADPSTRVIAVVSKPPSAPVAKQVMAVLAATPKPCAVHFVSGGSGAAAPPENVVVATSLADLALQSLRLAGAGVDTGSPERSGRARVADLSERLGPGARLCGLFCGGTTGQEALARLSSAGLDVHSNLHKQGPLRVDGRQPVNGHLLLDLGDDEFTRGRPHPMIEPALRNERMQEALSDRQVDLLLFDCVLGYGAHPDPAGVLVGGLAAARAAAPGRALLAIASVTGTADDPQDYRVQVATLTAAGVVVERSNDAASELAASVLLDAAARGQGSA